MIYITGQASVERKVRRKGKPGKGTTAERVSPETGLKKASLFMNGRSQAVRLPKEFRFEGTHVYAKKVGDTVVLSAIDDRWEKFLAAYGSIPDFPDIEDGPPQDRPELDAWIDASA